MDQRPWLDNYPSGVPQSLAPYPDQSLYSALESSARRFPDAPAISFRPPGAPAGKVLSYAELLRQVDQFGHVLTSQGITTGDRVGLLLPNCPQFVIAYYACMRIGAVVVAANPLYTREELAHQFKDAGIEICVALENLYPTLGAVRDEIGLRNVIATKVTDFMPFPLNRLAPLRMKREARHEGTPWPPVPSDADVKWWKDLMRASYPASPPADVDPQKDLAGLIYTGGTTGFAKGVMLTHSNLLANAMQSGAWNVDLEEGKDAVMCVLPFFHSYGMTVAMNVGILHAHKLVLELRFDLKTVLEAIQREKPTLFPGVPRLYIAVNEGKETPNFDLTSVRACLSGAAPLPTAVAEKFEELTGARLVEGYGLTEASPVTHANPIYGERKAGSIGLPIPDTDCRIADLDDWTKEVEPGEKGELLIAGPQVMQGYYNRPEETEQVLKTDEDGKRWLLTGDIARMDEEGYFSIVDRKKEMILVSGFNVYPTEVEQVLYRHPKVQKVTVAGIPDEVTGEAVKAYIVLRAGETATADEMIEFCRESLTGYRVPKYIEFRDSLPETLVGKVLRRVLLEEERKRASAAS